MAQAQGLTSRRFSILLVATLAVLTVQGWTGDTVNIFYAPANGVSPPGSISEFWSIVASIGSQAVWHAAEGIILAALAVAVAALSFMWSESRGVRIASILALLMVMSAAAGGLEFVMSGFANGGNSAQMGGSFLGAYAFYFIALYYSRNVAGSKA